MAKALIHFTNTNLTPLPITLPDKVAQDEEQLRRYLRVQVVDTVGKKSSIRCIWLLAENTELRAYYPIGNTVECRTYDEDELINASLDSRYATLRTTGRILVMLEEGKAEPFVSKMLCNTTDFHIVGNTEAVTDK